MTLLRCCCGRFVIVAGVVLALSVGSVVDCGDAAPTGGSRSLAQDAAPPDATHRFLPRGDFRIDLPDRPDPLKPAQPRTSDDQRRLDAIAWFMKGRFLESREEFKAALEAYEKAVELNPRAVEVYRVLIPLAFGLNDGDLAIKYALKAIELMPDDYMLLQRVGIHLATKDKIPEALKLLEQASRSDKLDRQSPQYVAIMRDLAVLYLLTAQIEKSADAFEVILDAKNEPDKYRLDFQMKSELEKQQRTTYEAIGQVFLEAKRPERAIVALERAAKAKKTKPGNISFSLAQAYFLTENSDKALEHLQTYFDAQLQSKGPAAYQLLADILKVQNKSEQLIPQLENLAARDQQNQTLQYFLAKQYIAADRLADAETLFKKSLDREKTFDGYLGLASLYRKQGRPADLLTALAQGVSRVSDFERIVLSVLSLSRDAETERAAAELERELQAITADEQLAAKVLEAGRQLTEGESAKPDFASSLLLGRIAEESKQAAAADKFYRLALKLRRDRAGSILEQLGKFYLEMRLFAESAKVFQEAVNDPTLTNQKPNFLFLASQAEEMAGNTAGALAAIAEARKAIPDHPLLAFQEAWIHYHAHNWDQAVPLLEKFIEKNANHRLARQCQFSLSNIHVQKGDVRKGEEILEKVFAEEPNDPSVNNDLGYLYADQGKNLEQARGMIEKALKAEPDNAAYQDSMGWVLFKLGKYQEAAPFLENAVSSPRGGDATIFDHLGDVQEKLGQKEKAVTNWQKALKDAKEEKRPDQKLIEKIEEKLKKAQ